MFTVAQFIRATARQVDISKFLLWKGLRFERWGFQILVYTFSYQKKLQHNIEEQKTHF